MHKSSKLYLALAVAISAVLLPGCRRKPHQAELSPEALEQQTVSAIGRAFDEARALLGNGLTNDALAKLSACVADPRHQKYRAMMFSGQVQFLLEAGLSEEAKRIVAVACVQEPPIAGVALEMLYQDLFRRGGHAEVAVWAAELTALPGMPAALRRRLIDLRLAAVVALQDDEAVEVLLAQILKEASPADAAALAGRTLEAHIAKSRIDAAGRVLSQLAAVETPARELADLVVMFRVRLAALSGEWDEVPALFASAGDALADPQLRESLRQIVDLARQAGRYPVAEQICETLLSKQAGKAGAQALAARSWAEIAMVSNRVDLPRRFNGMMEARLPATEIAAIFQRHYYNLVDDPALIRKMCETGEKIIPLLSDRENLKSMKTMVLDGAFILEDYDVAVLRLEAGIPDRDESWHKMAIAKVKAHRALKNNQPREAVQFFRDFMACYQAAKDVESSDPTTGVLHSREMILGRNAKRIAEILTSLPDAAAAASAYEEARGYYRLALEKAEPESRRIIETEMAQIPKE